MNAVNACSIFSIQVFLALLSVSKKEYFKTKINVCLYIYTSLIMIKHYMVNFNINSSNKNFLFFLNCAKAFIK